MTKVKRIVVSGFRGLRAALPLDLQKGGQPQSVILYGANGSGKSSITDAWEWLATGKIHHLAREGAEESAYPHLAALPNATYVEIEFTDQSIGTVRLTFDNDRITLPKAQGRIDLARKLLEYPCHVRHGDLARFILLTKAERYDSLASLMGFVPQMEYQKGLRRVERQLETDVETKSQLLSDTEARFKQHFALAEPSRVSALHALSETCASHGFNAEPTVDCVRNGSEKLKAALANDPNAKLLADLQTVETAVKMSKAAVSRVRKSELQQTGGTASKSSKAPQDLDRQLADLRNAAAQLKAEQKEQLHSQLRIPLFQAANDLLARIGPTLG